VELERVVIILSKNNEKLKKLMPNLETIKDVKSSFDFDLCSDLWGLVFNNCTELEQAILKVTNKAFHSMFMEQFRKRVKECKESGAFYNSSAFRKLVGFTEVLDPSGTQIGSSSYEFKKTHQAIVTGRFDVVCEMLAIFTKMFRPNELSKDVVGWFELAALCGFFKIGIFLFQKMHISKKLFAFIWAIEKGYLELAKKCARRVSMFSISPPKILKFEHFMIYIEYICKYSKKPRIADLITQTDNYPHENMMEAMNLIIKLSNPPQEVLNRYASAGYIIETS